MLIDQSTLKAGALSGDVAVVTGAGRGIGYEAARALLWLGANVVAAEIDGVSCTKAVSELQHDFGAERAIGVRADVGKEEDVSNIARAAGERFGRVDVVLNNATALTIGAVRDTGIDYWDRGYRVNVRGPVLLARAFLPGMVARKHGAFVCVSSSGAAPFMGPYEVFKTAQVELANTLAAELEGTGVCAYTIGPGVVRTPGFLEGGSRVAALMGMSTDELLEMNKSVELSVEEAGVGFAASIALASKYSGTETSSIQVLRDIGLGPAKGERKAARPEPSDVSAALLDRVVGTYAEQSKGWKERNLFQRQWVFRDFKKQTGMSVDEMGAELAIMKRKNGGLTRGSRQALEKLNAYYRHQQDLQRGFEKDPDKLDQGLKAIQSWIDEIQALLGA